MATSLDEHILINFGGVSQNNFLNLLNSTEDDSEDVTDFNLSHYHLVDDLAQVLDNRLDQFTILSLNTQSINAKFNDLVILIESLRNINFEFAAICLQETWLDQNADLSLLQLTNYQCISQGKHCSQHGGLIIYYRRLRRL